MLSQAERVIIMFNVVVDSTDDLEVNVSGDYESNWGIYYLFYTTTLFKVKDKFHNEKQIDGDSDFCLLSEMKFFRCCEKLKIKLHGYRKYYHG